MSVGLYFVCLVFLGNLKIWGKIIICYDDGFGKYGFIRNNLLFGLLFVCVLSMLGYIGLYVILDIRYLIGWIIIMLVFFVWSGWYKFFFVKYYIFVVCFWFEFNGNVLGSVREIFNCIEIFNDWSRYGKWL